jgi:hypothetical protein
VRGWVGGRVGVVTIVGDTDAVGAEAGGARYNVAAAAPLRCTARARPLSGITLYIIFIIHIIYILCVCVCVCVYVHIYIYMYICVCM